MIVLLFIGSIFAATVLLRYLLSIEPSVGLVVVFYFTAVVLVSLVIDVILINRTRYKKWYIAAFSCLYLTIISNCTVMVANGGYMPVRPDIFAKAENPPIYYISGGNMLALGDCYFGGASIGDMFILLGATIMIILSVQIFIRYVFNLDELCTDSRVVR